MLQQVSRLLDCRVRAVDGEIGRIDDVHFDDTQWVVRHLVVHTGRWLSGRDVLVSPYAVRLVNVGGRAVAVDLTRERVERSPPVESDKLVSRQHETEHYRYYGYPAYWLHPTFWAGGSTPVIPGPVIGAPAMAPIGSPSTESSNSDATRTGDSHLRSSSEVMGYRVHTLDGSLGHVDDLLFDECTWAIGCLIIDTRHWLPGRRILLGPHTIEKVDWAAGAISVTQTREQLKEAPEFDVRQLRARRSHAPSHAVHRHRNDE